MNRGKTMAFLAVNGMITGLCGCGPTGRDSVPTIEIGEARAAPDEPSPRPKRAGKRASNCCKGMNDCKGKGMCKTDKHDCKGMNACKGRGGCKPSDCSER